MFDRVVDHEIDTLLHLFNFLYYLPVQLHSAASEAGNVTQVEKILFVDGALLE